MAKRRKLPAPPLVLGQYIARMPQSSKQAVRLRALAKFLKDRELLTDGGKSSLRNDLLGRNEVVSLGLQDVKSCAHGLAESLWRCEQTSGWPALTKDYFQTYDRGKPRRPTHLQRLYLEWSATYDWAGLLRVLPFHEHLWSELRLALERLDDPLPDKECLLLALACRQTIQPWLSAWQEGSLPSTELLRLLPHLNVINPTQRLRILNDLQDQKVGPDWVRACHCTQLEAQDLNLERHEFCRLEVRAVRVLEELDVEFLDPLFVSAFRGFITSEETVTHLRESISPTDPLRRVVYGARPGRNWLEVLEAELFELIALRSVLSQ